LSADTSFSAKNLDRLATWFRYENNWPHNSIPRDAAEALFSIGRPPLTASNCGRSTAIVDCDRQTVSQGREPAAPVATIAQDEAA